MAANLVNSAEGAKRRALIGRILASEAFRRSPKLTEFLNYVVDHSSKDERELLSEQQLGIAVFGRPPGYNASDDSIVRVQAHKLRERLAEYFDGEGASEPIVVTVPKGKYCLVFASRPSAPTPEPALPAPQTPSHGGRRLGKPALAAVLLFVTAIGLGMAIDRWWATSVAGTAKALSVDQPLLPNPILRSVLSPPKKSIVVIEDTMLVLAAELRGAPFSLSEYLSERGDTPALPGVFTSDRVRTRVESLLPRTRYVNLANVTFAVGLLRSYPHLSKEVVFRHPREIQMRDIRSSNCILFGGQLSNPWIDLYEDRLNFHLRAFTEGTGFENRHPQPGERASYGDPKGGDKLTYARVALLRNFEPGTRALVLTGMGGPETEAAAERLLDPDFLKQLPPQLRAQLRTLPSHVEILLSARRVGRIVEDTQVVAWRASEDPATPSDSR